MSRLPQPGSDGGKWGTILNDFLVQSHNANGTLKTSAVTSAALAGGGVTTALIADGAVTTPKIADGAVTPAKLQGVGGANGIATLDSGGLLPEAQVPVRLTSSQLGSTYAPISLVSDVAAKAADSSVVKLTGDQTVAGIKTFSSAPVVPDASFTISKTNGLQAALDAKVIKTTQVINMLDVVGTNNGTTDQGPALNAVIAALTAEPNSFGACPSIYFPRGMWIISSNIVNSSSKKFNIYGDGPGQTILKRPSGSTGDFITLGASYTSLKDLTLEGGRYQGVTGDLVVLNGAYTRVENVVFNKSGENALVIGKAGAAIAHVLDKLMFRENAGRGIYTVAGSGCTDGMWSNIDIGNTGKYGVYLGTGSQNATNVHVWGSGLESTTERDGIFLESGGNEFTNWQSEKNLGRGVHIESNNNSLKDGRGWANTLGAIYILSASYNSICENNFHQNSVTNTGGSTSAAFATIYIEGTSSRNTISNNTFWDSSGDIDAGSYVTAPTYPYPGKTGGVFTHTFAIAESGSVDNNVIIGNNAPRELTRLNSTTPPYIIVGNGDKIASNNWGTIPVPTRSISSGAVRIPAESDTIIVSASATITSVLGGSAGRVARIIFTNASPSPVTDNGTTLNLNGDFNPTTNDVLTLISDGTNWYEVSRSTN